MTTPIVLSQGLRSLDTYAGTFQAWLQSLTLRLYKNSHTPAVTDTNASYTEANFDGYASASLSGFGAASLDGNNNDLYSAADIIFTMTGSTTPNTVYGYYWTDGSGNVVAAEDNGGGFAMSGPGYSYTVSPRFYVGQILPPL